MTGTGLAGSYAISVTTADEAGEIFSQLADSDFGQSSIRSLLSMSGPIERASMLTVALHCHWAQNNKAILMGSNTASAEATIDTTSFPLCCTHALLKRQLPVGRQFSFVPVQIRNSYTYDRGHCRPVCGAPLRRL